jgi:hypothetical protein
MFRHFFWEEAAELFSGLGATTGVCRLTDVMDSAGGLEGIGFVNLIGPIVSAAPLPHAGSLIERLGVDLAALCPAGRDGSMALPQSPRVRGQASTQPDGHRLDLVVAID